MWASTTLRSSLFKGSVRCLPPLPDLTARERLRSEISRSDSHRAHSSLTRRPAWRSICTITTLLERWSATERSTPLTSLSASRFSSYSGGLVTSRTPRTSSVGSSRSRPWPLAQRKNLRSAVSWRLMVAGAACRTPKKEGPIRARVSRGHGRRGEGLPSRLLEEPPEGGQVLAVGPDPLRRRFPPLELGQE